MLPQVLTVLLEYSPRQQRVIVRQVAAEYKPLPVLEDGNVQNAVKVFLGVDMKFNVGFSGLTPVAPDRAGGSTGDGETETRAAGEHDG